MTTRSGKPDAARLDRIVADARRASDERAKGYRERALKLLPWICGRCAREFDRSNVHQLTVHHRDHDHHNNPPDGSNWELLCLYCHENEHARQQVADVYGAATSGEEREPASTYRAFAALEDLLKRQPGHPDAPST